MNAIAMLTDPVLYPSLFPPTFCPVVWSRLVSRRHQLRIPGAVCQTAPFQVQGISLAPRGGGGGGLCVTAKWQVFSVCFLRIQDPFRVLAKRSAIRSNMHAAGSTPTLTDWSEKALGVNQMATCGFAPQCRPTVYPYFNLTNPGPGRGCA